MQFPTPIAKLVEGFMRLPGIGPKTAERLAFFVLSMEEDDVMDFAKALVGRKAPNCFTVPICHNITDRDPCAHM